MLCITVLKVDTDPLHEEYDDVFEGLGKLDGKYSIVTDNSVKSAVHPPWRLPAAMSEKVQRKLQEMTTDDAIAKVDQPTHWVSSMLVVIEPPSEVDGETKIRICLDPRNLNVALKREHVISQCQPLRKLQLD